MNWIDIQKLLNELEEKYNSLYLLNDYILKEENYDIDNMKAARYIFFLMKQIKKSLSTLPKNMDEVRSVCITYGNDTKKLEEKLKKILKGIDELFLGVSFVKLLVEISNKTYRFEGGYEKSLMYKNELSKFSKVAKMIGNKDLTRKEKYEQYASYENSLSKEDKGELYVQEFIAIPNLIYESRMILDLVKKNVKNNENPYIFLERLKLTNLEINAYKEDLLDEEPLSEKLKVYDAMESSPFIKNMKNNKIK